MYKDIEKRIIQFIKKSPFGVTSSEIARVLGLNRMTITKYLAIIKEKALIDFKRLGMAKIWFIPVRISKEDFFKRFVLNLCIELNKSKPIQNTTLKMADYIVNLYLDFYGTKKLTYAQLLDAISDAYAKIGGECKVVNEKKNSVSFKIVKCPFDIKIRECPILCNFTSDFIGKMFSRNLGYAKVCIKKSIATNSEECEIIVYTKNNKAKGKEY